MTPDTPPSPGSDAAIANGCTCPIMDNAHGKGYMGVPGIYVYSGDCPLHRLKPEPRPLTVIPEELPEPSEEYQRALERLREDPAFRLIAPDLSPKFTDEHGVSVDKPEPPTPEP